MKSQFNSLLQLLDFFNDEETCKAFLGQQRWGDTPSCPHCGCTKAYVTNRGFKCSEKTCYKKFTVTTGTIFENTKIKLRTWFAAMYLVTAHKKGISSLQLSRDLNITQKTAWFVLHRIREMLREKAPQMLEGTVECDETYVGGKAENKHKKVRKELREKGTGYVNKTPVFGLLQREGNVHTFVMSKEDGATLKPILREKVSASAMVVTDGFGAYGDLHKEFKAHEIINHAQDEYVRGEFHTNSIEGFWSQLERGIYGIYHNVSPKHLHRYCHEFGYRYNNRKVTDCARFHDAVNKVGNTRLTYKALIANNK
ncbi:IS1595 family transposase [Pontibacter flavimaris]|uniref:ISXO2-like transposase domain-containing protein n=1 Tax=Pontibacter flavimaris TaxID=1797110 RepID=A0A1Q5PAB5_9BACT|nr:IS1595 family transposase [Pontibacter flavimaris]OKL39179.1 hypothetical protein A3841_04350 [Pontibacter flavimaris]